MQTSTSLPATSLGRFFIGLCVGAALGFGACYGILRRDQPNHPVAEAKLCYLALKHQSTALQPQTREYLKSRLYVNAAHDIERSWLEGWELDFGPVDEQALAGLSGIKGPYSADEVYRAALAKAGIAPGVR